MNFLTNLNELVMANEALVVTGIAVAFIVLQVAMVLYALFNQPETDEAAANNVVMDDAELEMYATFGFSPWLF